MSRAVYLWCVLVVLAGLWAFGGLMLPGEKISGERVEVKDGDTIVLDGVTVRLFGMDAPEYRQVCKDRLGFDWPCGKIARQKLVALVAAGDVTCRTRAADQYRRKIASCSAAGEGDLGRAMVVAGLALSPADRGKGVYEAEQESARAAGRGIWQGKFTTPAEWREADLRKDSR